MADDTIPKSFEYKLKHPNKALVAKLEDALEMSRFVYNCALEQRIDWMRRGRVISYYEQSSQLTEARNSLADLRVGLRMMQQEALIRLNRAFDDFYRRRTKGRKCGFPRFKTKTQYKVFGLQIAKQDACPLRGDKIHIPGIGICRVFLSRSISGKVKQLRMVCRADGWYVQLVCDSPIPVPLPELNNPVGIDVGIVPYVTLSTGDSVDNPRLLRNAQKRLRYSWNSFIKKPKSKNREKARNKSARRYLKVQRSRLDFQHKLALNIVRNFNPIGVERLNIENMKKHPRLTQHVIDAAWGQLIRLLTIKAECAGRQVFQIESRQTSKRCSYCGTRCDIAQNEKTFSCSSCGLVIDRDLNAAKNIRQGMPDYKPVERAVVNAAMKQEQAHA